MLTVSLSYFRFAKVQVRLFFADKVKSLSEMVILNLEVLWDRDHNVPVNKV